MKQSQLIDKLIGYTKGLKNSAVSHQNLPATVLNARPVSGGWNVLECYEHMNRFGKLYLGFAEDALLKAPPESRDFHYRPGIVGGWSVRSMEPQEVGVKMPMKTWRSMDPKNNEIDAIVIRQFVKQQEAFEEILVRARKVNIDKVKSRTTLKLMKFKLSDAIYFNTNHNRRHMVQIERILRSEIE